MHKNRSPCITALTGTLTTSGAGHFQEGTLTLPTRERFSEPPPELLTPDRVAARGLAAIGTITDDVLLHEDAPFVPRKPAIRREKREDNQTVTVVKIDVAYCDIINRNGLFYPRSCYEAANARAQPDLPDGGLYSLMDHPEYWEPVKGSLPNICIKIEKVGIEDREVEWPIGSGQTKSLGVVFAQGIIVETAKGLDAQALLKAGVRVGVSTNGWASINWARAGDLDPNYYDPEELIPVIQDDFTYFSIDLVSDPSNLGGRARTETRRPFPSPAIPAPLTPPVKEGTMHELLLALMEKYPGKMLDQIKTEHAAEYIKVTDQILVEGATPAGTENAPAAPVAALPAIAAPAAPALPAVDYSATTVDMAAYRALESRVVLLTQENGTLREQLRNQTRDTIALTALEAARLPSSGQFEEGGVTIDLDASFRQDLISFSRSAASDTAAREAVERKIAERRAVVGGRTQESRRTPGPFGHLSSANRGPQVPVTRQATDEHVQESYAPVMNAFRDLL